jgi:hypothetical protein
MLDSINTRVGEGSDVNLLHVTQTTLELVTLVIVAFGFSDLVVVDAPRFLFVKGKYSPTLPSSRLSRYGSFIFHP